MITELFNKENNTVVQVYHFYEDGTVLTFSPWLAGKQNGNGWQKTKIKNLVPKEYMNLFMNGTFISKTKRNQIKARLRLTKAEWTCTDGVAFDSCDDAINHEAEIVNNIQKEKE